MRLVFVLAQNSIAASIWVLFQRWIFRKALWVNNLEDNLIHFLWWFNKLLFFFFKDIISSFYRVTWWYVSRRCLTNLFYRKDWRNVFRSVLRLSLVLFKDPFWSVNLLINKLSKGKERSLRNFSTWGFTHILWVSHWIAISYYIRVFSLILQLEIRNILPRWDNAFILFKI